MVDLTSGPSHQFVVVPVDSNGNPLASGLQISVDAVDKSSIKTKDSTLYVGQKWNKEDNFVSATDEDSNSVPYSDKRITTNGSSIDTSKPGVYEVNYSYKGVLKNSDFTFEVTVVSKEEWFYQIVEAHQSWGGEAATATIVSRIEFDDPNLVEIMKHQPYSYRVVYTDNLRSSHNFDVTKPASDPNPYFHCVFLDFREYKQGQPIKYRLYSYDTETEIYVVLENGYQIKLFDTDDIN